MDIPKTKLKLIRQLKMKVYEKYYNTLIINDEKGIEILKDIEKINKDLNQLIERIET